MVVPPETGIASDQVTLSVEVRSHENILIDLRVSRGIIYLKSVVGVDAIE